MNEINDLDDFEPSRVDGRGGIVKLIPFFCFLGELFLSCSNTRLPRCIQEAGSNLARFSSFFLKVSNWTFVFLNLLLS